MAYTQYNFNEDNCKKYKGIDYYKFNDCYIVILPNGIQCKKFTLRGVKECINEYIMNDTKK